MIHYFINIKNKQEGPFSFEELINKKIQTKTKVWKTGLKHWTTANNLNELLPHLIPTPPPINTPTPVSIKTRKKISKYDDNYAKDSFAVVVGVIILITTITVFKTFEFTEESIKIFRVGIILMRIFITIRVVSIAKCLNRDKLLWGVFAFLLPSIALIAIGLSRKIRDIDYFDKNNTNTTKNNLNIEISLAQWRLKNPKKSLNDYCAEIKQNKAIQDINQTSVNDPKILDEMIKKYNK